MMVMMMPYQLTGVSTAQNRRNVWSTSDFDTWLGDPEAISSVRRARKPLTNRRIDQASPSVLRHFTIIICSQVQRQ